VLKYAVEMFVQTYSITFDRYICDLPQHPLKSISAPPRGASTPG